MNVTEEGLVEGAGGLRLRVGRSSWPGGGPVMAEQASLPREGPVHRPGEMSSLPCQGQWRVSGTGREGGMR